MTGSPVAVNMVTSPSTSLTFSLNPAVEEALAMRGDLIWALDFGDRTVTVERRGRDIALDVKKLFERDTGRLDGRF